MKRFLEALCVVLAMLPVTSSAFDGNRKGFVLGGGLGVSAIARWSCGVDGEHKVGFGYHFLAGYGWDQNDLLVYEANGALYHSLYNSDSLIGSGSLLTSQGFQGAVWCHYYGPAGRSPFTAVGLGFYSFYRGEDYHSDPGAGYLIGGGYEFTPHVQAELYFSGGRTFDAGRSFGHNHLNVLVSGIAF